MSKNENSFSIRNFVLSHRFIFTILIVLFSILFMIIPLFFLKIESIQKDLCLLEVLEISSIIVANLFLVIGTTIAVWQYYISCTHKIATIKNEQIEKSVQLSGYYKCEILMYFSAIKYVFKKIDIFDLMLKHMNEMHEFDMWERKQIFSNEELKRIEEARKSTECINAIIEINDIYDLNLFTIVDKENPSDEEKKIILLKFWGNIVIDVLNNTEYFSMHFSHQVADQTAIYQSIHPSYIEMCCILYYDISKCNDTLRAKLYSNVTHLFNLWKTISDEQNGKAMRKYREVSNIMGNVAQEKF